MSTDKENDLSTVAGCTPATGMAEVVDRNIKALLERNRQAEQRKSFENKLADSITRFTGSLLFVYLHLLLFGGWIVINVGWMPGVPKFDPSFVILAMAASVEAIFLSTFVLISQNRMAEMADRRADLNLQISLLAEHEVTKLIRLVTEIGNRMGINESRDPELEELGRDVAPETVMEKIEQVGRETSTRH